jgi:hypothetical protein
MVDSVKGFPIGKMVKVRCSLGYSEAMHTLFLVMDSDELPMVEVVIAG